ncbi:phytase [Halosquirtibacter laminarini]|uniref:Phytase n=1 Tax=Halosquirtibacter laminarini TaxID=3374600 RepID=A0AC61NB94_9BACT|nr:phytase [Prolixibacteraceae bacterium]
MKLIPVIILMVSLLWISCGRKSEGVLPDDQIDDYLVASAETQPVSQNKHADAADDIAIWVAPSSPDQSLILGTDKKAGLAVYNLEGEKRCFFDVGRLNNVDIRTIYDGSRSNWSLAAASNRSTNSIIFFWISPLGKVSLAEQMPFNSTMKEEVYGLTMGYEGGDLYVFVNTKAGEVMQWRVEIDSKNKVGGTVVRKLNMTAQVEGMVCDDDTGLCYIGEEEVGIYQFQINPYRGDSPKLLKESSVEENQNIVMDIEGITIWKRDDNKKFLIASSQGNYSYAVFRLPENRYIGSFRVKSGDGIDSIEETDGLDITSAYLGESYPEGVFVVQDGFNRNLGKIEAQNFKIISNEPLRALVDRLVVESSGLKGM